MNTIFICCSVRRIDSREWVCTRPLIYCTPVVNRWERVKSLQRTDCGVEALALGEEELASFAIAR